jgi:hypothetical protein
MAQSSVKDYGPAYTGLNPGFAGALQQLINASGGRLWINSGYRSDARQVQLWNDALAKYGSEQAASNWVAKPESLGGKGSNHTRGLAADLGGDLALAHQLAPQFGLVFPLYNEAWHIEPAWARDKNGNVIADPQQMTAGHPNDPATGQPRANPYGSLHTQLVNFQSILKGELPTAGTQDAAQQDQQQPTNPQQMAQASTGGHTTGNVDPAKLYQLLKANGLDPAHAAAFVAIAGRESGYNAGNANLNAGTGDQSYGLFQVNKIGGMHPQYSVDMLQTAEGSAQAAADMYKNGGSRPWGPYKGMSWLYNTQDFWNTASQASGGEVSVDQIAALQNEGL